MTANSYRPAGEMIWLPGGAPGNGGVARARFRRLADRDVIECVSPETLVPPATILEAIRASAARTPEKTAIRHLRSVEGGEPSIEISYVELLAAIERAAALFQRDAAPGTPVVAIILPMIPEALVATWGAGTVGTAVPINPHLEVEQAAAIIRRSGATLLVTANSAFGPGTWDRLDELGELAPELRHIYVVGAKGEARDFATAMCAADVAALREKAVGGDAIYLPTGGTTGAPKLVRMTHRGQLLNAWSVGTLMGAGEDEVVGHALPLFHVGGLVTIALRAMLFGQTLVTLTTDGFRDPAVIRHFWKLMRDQGITTTVITPTTAAALVAQAEFEGGQPLRSCLCGGSAVPLEVANAFHQRFGLWLREGWGLSEAYGIVTTHIGDGDRPRIGAAGQPLPFYRTRAIIVDAENRFVRECAIGERGVIAISSSAVTPGYLDADLDAGLIVENAPNGERLANSGDLGSTDADDYVWIFGRAKDLIIRGGHNIDPRAIEEALALHPDVQMAAAIGRPDRLKGEMPMAYVQLKPGASASADQLLAFAARHINERAAVPVEIVLKALPLTPVGKVFKPALKADATRRAIAATIEELFGLRLLADVELDEQGARLTAIVRLVDASPSDVERLSSALGAFEFGSSVVADLRC